MCVVYVSSYSVWFNSPRMALIVSFIVFFMAYVPAVFINIPQFYDRIP